MRGSKTGPESDGPRRGRWSEAERARLEELYGLRDDVSISRELNRPVASVRKMAEKLFPPIVEDGPWTDEEVERLKRYLGASSIDVVARVLKRSIENVEAKIESLGRVQNSREWTREEIAEFKRIYGTRTDEDLTRIFGRPESAVHDLARRYALAKDKAFLRRLKGDAATRMPRWTNEEVELLKREYPTTPNVDLAQILGRSLKSVVSKAHNLGLKKSPDRLRAMGRENVSLRYHPERVVQPHPAPRRDDAPAPSPAAEEPETEPARTESAERTFELRPHAPESAGVEGSAPASEGASEAPQDKQPSRPEGSPDPFGS